MNKEFFTQLVLTLAGVFMISSCKPPSKPPQDAQNPPESGIEEQMGPSQEKPFSDGTIESVAELMAELDEVAQGKNESKVLESALQYSEGLDESVEDWNGSVATLAIRFNDLAPGGNPSDNFFEKFGLAGHDSEQEPQVEVEMLVRTIRSLASSRPDLLQELLVRKSRDATQAESDLVVYAISLESVMENSGLFRRTGYSGIVSLRESENPVYRLLAAKLMPMLELDLRSLAEFYRPSVAEKDETILLAVIDGLTTSGTSEALEMLQEIAATNREGSSNVAVSAKRALELVAARKPE
jgi:hypothetical protein